MSNATETETLPTLTTDEVEAMREEAERDLADALYALDPLRIPEGRD